MPKIITLAEKEMQLFEALKDESVTTQAKLAQKMGVSLTTAHCWLSDSVQAQIMFNKNKKGGRTGKVKAAIKKVDDIAAKGLPLYRAAAIAGISINTYWTYRGELR